MSTRLYRPNTSRLFWWLIPLLALDLTACCTLRPRATEHEIDIRFANGGGKEPLIEPISGWPLTLSLTANEETLLGIGTDSVPHYPNMNFRGLLVFADPDACPSWVDPVWQADHHHYYPQCSVPLPWPPDETYVEFRPGISPPDIRNEDDSQEGEPEDPPEDGERPLLWTYPENPDGDPFEQLTPIGPEVGSTCVPQV